MAFIKEYDYLDTEMQSIGKISGAGIAGQGINILDALLVYGFAYCPPSSTSFSISTITYANPTATVTTSTNHGFVVGQYVWISGVQTDLAYNGLFKVATQNGTTQFTFPVGVITGTYTASTGIVAAASVFNVSSLTVTANVATVSTSVAHGFVSNQYVLISGATNDVLLNGEFLVTVTSSTQFTYPVTTTGTALSGTVFCKSNRKVCGTQPSPGLSCVPGTPGIVTLTTTSAHGFNVGEIVLVAGAADAVFNGEFVIVSIPSNTTLTYNVTTTALSSTTTSTLITVKNASLGWSKPFAGTNLAVYRSNDVTGTQLYLKVDDTVVNYMTVTMYESMSSISSGTGASTSVLWRKTDATITVINSAVRPWYLVGNTKTFYFMIDCYGVGTNYNNQPNPYMFGDFNSYKSGDVYNCSLVGYTAIPASYPYTNNDFIFVKGAIGSYPSSRQIARAYHQLGSVITYFTSSSVPVSAISMAYSTPTLFPNYADQSLHLFPIYIFENVSYYTLRGVLPGVYNPLENLSGIFQSRNPVTISGKTYIAYTVSCGTSTTFVWGTMFIDITGPW